MDVGNKQHQAEPQGESAQHDEAQLDHCEMVNAEVVQGKIVFLPGGICWPKRCSNCGGTAFAKTSVNTAEVFDASLRLTR